MNGVNTETLELELLGSILYRTDAIHELPAGFTAAALSPVAAKAFVAAEKLARAGHPSLSVPVVAAEAGIENGGISWLRAAVDSASTNSVRLGAEKLLDRARRRALRDLLRKASDALETDRPTDEITGTLAARLLDIDSTERPETVSFRESALEVIDTVEKSKRPGGGAIPTGLPSVDDVLWIHRGRLVIVAAEAGVGKSTFELNVAFNVASAIGPVLVHTLEMSNEECSVREIARGAMVGQQRFFDRTPLNGREADAISKAVDERVDLPIAFNSEHFSLGAIVRITEKAHRKAKADQRAKGKPETGLALVAVDYLQLVEAGLGPRASRNEQVGAVTRALKQLAKRLRIPVLALSQLNRGYDRRKPAQKPQKRAGAAEKPRDEYQPIPPPRLSDLRDSGCIEQDADAVAFLHNPYAEHSDETKRRYGPFALTVAKQRMGPTGQVGLSADLAFARFIDRKGAHDDNR